LEQGKTPIYKIVASLGPSKSQAFPRFQSAWDTWISFEEVTATFLVLSKGPEDVK